MLPIAGRVDATLDEHREIIDALERRNVKAATEAARRHMRQLLTYLEPLEESRPELFRRT